MVVYFDTREGTGNPLQYSCLKDPMDRGTWWATVHGVTKSQTSLNDSTHTHTHTHTRISLEITSHAVYRTLFGLTFTSVIYSHENPVMS